MPLIDATEVAEMHAALTHKQHGIIMEERCLSNDVIDTYQLGVTMKYGDPRVTIPIRNSAGEFEDVRCWLHPKRRTNGASKILHWNKGYGGARLFPIDMLRYAELVLVAGELDALAMISHGFKAITATAGESSWPDSLSIQMTEAGVEQVTVLADFDDTGLRGAEIRAKSLTTHGMKVKVASWT